MVTSHVYHTIYLQHVIRKQQLRLVKFHSAVGQVTANSAVAAILSHSGQTLRFLRYHEHSSGMPSSSNCTQGAH